MREKDRVDLPPTPLDAYMVMKVGGLAKSILTRKRGCGLTCATLAQRKSLSKEYNIDRGWGVG